MGMWMEEMGFGPLASGRHSCKSTDRRQAWRGQVLPELPMGVMATISLDPERFGFVRVTIKAPAGEVVLSDHETEFPSETLMAQIMLVCG